MQNKGRQEKTGGEKKIAEQTQKIVRLGDVDIPTSDTIVHGLTKIYGINWSLANAIVNALGFDKKTKFDNLDETSLEKLKNAIYNPKSIGIPTWLLNWRRFDPNSPEHYVGNQLKSIEEMYMETLKNSGTWRGYRHQFNYKVRGQRTRSRGANVKGRIGMAVGVLKKAGKKPTQQQTEEKK
jgi:ribosomal protein S13